MRKQEDKKFEIGMTGNGFSGNGFSGNGFGGNGFSGNGANLEEFFDFTSINLEEIVANH